MTKAKRLIRWADCPKCKVETEYKFSTDVYQTAIYQCPKCKSIYTERALESNALLVRQGKDDKAKKTSDSEKLYQCGFCGRYFVGSEYLTAKQLKKINPKKLDKVTLGYCPDAPAEDYQQNPGNYHHQVTRDMAIDAGDLSLEGQWI